MMIKTFIFLNPLLVLIKVLCTQTMPDLRNISAFTNDSMLLSLIESDEQSNLINFFNKLEACYEKDENNIYSPHIKRA